MAQVVELPIASILVGPRLRPVDHNAAAMLAVSMQESGQLTPVLVRPAPTSEAGAPAYELVAGGHRHAAVRRLGWETIRAEVRALTDAEAALIEVDENLIRVQLNPLDRATSIMARFEAWRERFPDLATAKGLKEGRKKNSRKMREFLGDAPVSMGFQLDTAREAGMSEHVVERAWTIARGLSPTLRAGLAGTWIARSESTLRQLAGFGDPVEQAAVIEVLLRPGATRSVSDARAIAAGNRPMRDTTSEDDARLAKMLALFGQCSPTFRKTFLHKLSGRSLPKGCKVEVEW